MNNIKNVIINNNNNNNKDKDKDKDKDTLHCTLHTAQAIYRTMKGLVLLLIFNRFASIVTKHKNVAPS